MSTLSAPAAADEDRVLPVADIMARDPAHARLPHDARYEAGAAYVIDGFCALDEARVPITDLGFNRADAVYDVVSVSRGQYFRLGHHQTRFARSLERMRLRSPFDAEQEHRLLDRLMTLTGLRDAYVWWGVTRGSMPARSSDRLNPDRFENRYYAFAIPYLFICNDEQRARGVNIALSRRHIRIPPRAVDPRAKNFHGLDLAMSLYEAGERDAEWSVLPDADGYLTESPGSNIFVIKDGVVATPDSGCLEGVTRQTAIDLCTEAGLTCEARRVRAEELEEADEAFMTSTAGGIMPVGAVDGRPLGGAPGPGTLTTRLHNLYWRKRWEGWDATPVDYQAGDIL
ncbi:MAG: aminotransferase class IV [Caulobacterales bacterium]|nr:aminotransferase class IV [Caulobacterales bacterium]